MRRLVAAADWRVKRTSLVCHEKEEPCRVGHSFTNPAADARGMPGFFYHADTDRRSWNAMIELFNETLK